jgi:two-component system chemotaxis response regulator CheB
MPNTQRRDIVVIGGSAGAVEALTELLERLPRTVPAAIFVTLHIPSDFPSILPEVLSRNGWKARHPQQHEGFERGVILVAPPDLHLMVEREEVTLSRGPRENRHRPAIDVMFRSAARAYGPRVVAVLLSGEMDDGSSGMMAVKMRGGLAVVQNPAEAKASEMPSRAIQNAQPDCVLSVARIADLLRSVTSEELRLAEPAGGSVSEELRTETSKANLEEMPSGENPGQPSAFACPECHGALWEVEEGGLLRFRCRVGHAYTADALRVAMTETTEDALWVAMRALEEKAEIYRRLAVRSASRMRAQYQEQAGGFDQHAKTIRKMLLESQVMMEEERHRSTGAEEGQAGKRAGERA